MAKFWQGIPGSNRVDINKIPKQEEWTRMLTEQLSRSYTEKKSYCIIWLANNKPVDQCNVNNITFGESAWMHLHIWDPDKRKRGSGTIWVKSTLPFFFENPQLKKIYCQPYALDPVPNKTLAKVGFHFIKEYITVPGQINFEQPVNLWELCFGDFSTLSPQYYFRDLFFAAVLNLLSASYDH